PLDEGEEIALGDRLSKPRQSLVRGDHAPANDALNKTAAVRIWDDVAQENRSLGNSFRSGDLGANVEDALRRFWSEDLAVRQSLCRVTGQRRRLCVIVPALMGASRMIHCPDS